jgi:hypothetical protein
MSLDIKEVIQIAREQFTLLLPELVIGPPPPAPIRSTSSPNSISDSMGFDIRLEELERDGNNWAITLSVPNPNFNPNALLEGIRNARHLARIAKVIVIDGSDGKLVALRERAA